jgi:type II secretory pathway component PulF
VNRQLDFSRLSPRSFEPLMMIGVGAIIGIIVIAVYLPMFKLLQLVQ